VSTEISELEDLKTKWRNMIKSRMEAHKLLHARLPNGVIHVSQVEQERFDTTRFKKTHPELAKEFVKPVCVTQVRVYPL
jgi:predicted phage-related endonuclease